MLWVLLSWLVASSAARPSLNCPILQTTDPKTPCHLRLVIQAYQTPPFVYQFHLPHPSRIVPCPLEQTVDRFGGCYRRPKASGDSPFYLTVPLPEGADTLDESVYPSKPPSELSFPNPIFNMK